MSFSSLPLSYCTNVHPGNSVADVIHGINEYTAKVRQKLDAPMAAGLWLARNVVEELQDEAALEQLAQAMWQNDLSCHTLNAFPFGDFHSERVKEQVYLPDWSCEDRLNYTRSCARILSKLLPEGSEGSISTVPLGGRMNPTEPDFHALCFRNLIKLAGDLKQIHEETGRKIRLAIEPEPLCEMSSTADNTVPLFRLLFEMAEATSHLDDVREYIGLCFDVCHQAVEFEEIPRSFDQIEDAGIRINKVHITNAIELRKPAENTEGRKTLLEYVEPRYLHQTFARYADGSIHNRLDLEPEDITRQPADAFLQAEAWRVHFHVPVYAETLGALHTTRDDLIAALRKVHMLEYAPHLEVETYTWPVMPGAAGQTDLVDQITQELQSASQLLAELS